MTSPNTIIADLTAEVESLRKQRDKLLDYLHDAATSLETIALRSYGDESYLNSAEQMRGYASSRAAVAREDIAIVKGGS